ncbi:hypothetical protein LB506_001372 [Fusarium annulatum]|nr:hypothetical protein LB506_001372 [Fusarium annulatum]
MATPIVTLSEEDESWVQWDPSVETVWPEVATPSPLPIPELPAPIVEKPSVELSWQERQARTDVRYKKQIRPSKLERMKGKQRC